tara:strand:+ start:4310 stop:5011 length:702 start_codon:yes stop_codon:yes gene_type:complete
MGYTLREIGGKVVRALPLIGLAGAVAFGGWTYRLNSVQNEARQVWRDYPHKAAVADLRRADDFVREAFLDLVYAPPGITYRTVSPLEGSIGPSFYYDRRGNKVLVDGISWYPDGSLARRRIRGASASLDGEDLSDRLMAIHDSLPDEDNVTALDGDVVDNNTFLDQRGQLRSALGDIREQLRRDHSELLAAEGDMDHYSDASFATGAVAAILLVISLGTIYRQSGQSTDSLLS